MDSFFTTNNYRVFEEFIKHPSKNFSARLLARMTGLSHATVLNVLKRLVDNSLIKRNDQTLYPTYYANTTNSEYVLYKQQWMLFRVRNSGIIAYLNKQCAPSCILLYGSAAKGSFTAKSDIDLFVQAKQTPLHLEEYERLLDKKIHVLFESNPEKLTEELKTNLVNATVLYGYIQPKQWITKNASKKK